MCNAFPLLPTKAGGFPPRSYRRKTRQFPGTHTPPSLSRVQLLEDHGRLHFRGVAACICVGGWAQAAVMREWVFADIRGACPRRGGETRKESSSVSAKVLRPARQEDLTADLRGPPSFRTRQPPLRTPRCLLARGTLLFLRVRFTLHPCFPAAPPPPPPLTPGRKSSVPRVRALDRTLPLLQTIPPLSA